MNLIIYFQIEKEKIIIFYNKINIQCFEKYIFEIAELHFYFFSYKHNDLHN